ncbi:MAG: aliphatic sulfonate ABC transporter substrate-binding protein [Negativicutes bacterium]|jgi:NitT/TauT family transport system substrate-binding protein
MTKIVHAVILLIVAIALVAAGCGKETVQPKQLRLGYFPNLTHAPALVGLDLQMFQKQLGQTVLTTRVFNAGPELMEAMAAGELDVAYIGPGPALTGFARGVPIKIIAGANNGGAILVASATAKINGSIDLANKKVVIPQLGNTQDISLRHILAANGLKDKAKGGNVGILQAAPSDVLMLFKQEQVDAALLPEPWGTTLEAQGGARVILEWNQVWNGGQYPTTVVIANDNYRKNNPEVMAAFLAAHREAISYIQANPQKAVQAVNRQLKKIINKELPESTLIKAFSRTMATDKIDQQILQDYADLMVESGYAKAKIDVKAAMSLE